MWENLRKSPAAATGGVLQEKVFLEISQNSQENTWARISFLIKLQAWSANCTSHFGPPYSFVNFKVYLVVAFFERSILTLG